MWNKYALIMIGMVALPACSKAEAQKPPEKTDYAGTWDDLPIADDDLQGLEQLLSDKWTYFLFEMDGYNLARDSSLNDDMAAKMSFVFADSFEFNAYLADGSEFGDVQGTYSPASWVEANDAERNFGMAPPNDTLLVPNFEHVLTVQEPGAKMLLSGYHEHTFVGAQLRLLIGETRHVARELIVYEKVDGKWRVTDYEETNFSASEASSPPMP